MADKTEKNEKKVKPKREKKEGKGLGRKIKEIGSELKKVTWPSFSTVVKSTGVVLAVVAIFLVILLGFDLFLSSFVYGPLTVGEIAPIGNATSFSTTNNFSNIINSFKAVL